MNRVNRYMTQRTLNGDGNTPNVGSGAPRERVPRAEQPFEHKYEGGGILTNEELSEFVNIGKIMELKLNNNKLRSDLETKSKEIQNLRINFESRCNEIDILRKKHSEMALSQRNAKRLENRLCSVISVFSNIFVDTNDDAECCVCYETKSLFYNGCKTCHKPVCVECQMNWLMEDKGCIFCRSLETDVGKNYIEKVL
jgi:hypothetical protein